MAIHFSSCMEKVILALQQLIVAHSCVHTHDLLFLPQASLFNSTAIICKIGHYLLIGVILLLGNGKRCSLGLVETEMVGLITNIVVSEWWQNELLKGNQLSKRIGEIWEIVN